jgi:hypothetical protein
MLAAGAVACALAGCGKGGTPGAGAKQATAPAHQPTSTSPSAPSNPGGGAPALSPARQRVFAAAVNLTAADLPGFGRSTKAREHETSGERDLQRKLARCTGGRLEGTAQNTEHSSGQFKRRGNAFDQSVGSSVTFLRSGAGAAPELKALRSPRTSACLRSYLNERFSGRSFGGAAIRRVNVLQGTPPAAGTAGGFGWRITAVVEVRKLRLPFYLDILGFIDGTAEVALTSSGLLVPFPAEREEHLYRLLLSRAQAHKP